MRNMRKINFFIFSFAFVVCSLLFTNCENPFMEEILGIDKEEGGQTGWEPVITPIPPEKLSTAERWSTWIDGDSTADIDISVDGEGVCTITVDGTAMTGTPAWDKVWRVNASYAYTAVEGKTYVYTFEAWTGGGERSLNVQWYNNKKIGKEGVYHNTGYYDEDETEPNYTMPTFSITSEPHKTYTIKASDYEDDPIPESGIQQLEFQCANQLGTFYVKIISIDVDLQAEVNKYSNATEDMIIRVPNNLTLTNGITIPANPNGKTLTITSESGGTYTISRDSAYTDSSNGLFIVSSGAKLVFENIVIDGNKENYSGNVASLVRVESGGEFTLKDGAVLQNNKAEKGGGVYLNGGTFTMSGGEISENNTSSDGGGVYINNGTFKMTGGKITKNTAGTDAGGGGVYFRDGNFIVGGTAKILGNSQGDTPSKNKDAHLYCADLNGENSRYITLGTGANAPDTGPDGMVIYVSINEHYPHNGIIVQSGATDAIAKCFRADDAGKKVTLLSGGQIKLVDINDGMDGLTSDTAFKVYNKATLRYVGIGNDNPDGYKGWTLDKCYELVADIDLTDMSGESNWTPIGQITGQFTGTFNGNRYTITGLTITAEMETGRQGMFGNIGSNGTVEKLALVDCNVIGGANNNIGGVAGVNEGTVKFCSVSGDSNISGVLDNVGGVVGSNNSGGIVENCYSTANVNWGSNIGGVVGSNLGTVSNCYSTGTVSGGSSVGGIVGDNQYVVKNCYSTGTVSGDSDVGGIVGDNQGVVENCYSTSTVSGDSYVGGIVGINQGTTKNCVALNPSVSANSDIGRVVGYSVPSGLANNHGLSDMMKNNQSTTWNQDALNSADGENAMSDEYIDQTWWEGHIGWDFDTVWEWDSAAMLPKLRNVGGQ